MSIEKIKLTEYLSQKEYPGRAIVLGLSEDGTKAVALYFIMGRSPNSRNRLFVKEKDGISTKAKDPRLMENPDLIIYHPVRESASGLIVTNGDQTETIAAFIKNGQSFTEALCTRTFEPDAPNFTPRISGLMQGKEYWLSILKAGDAAGKTAVREFFAFAGKPGIGHLIHTYRDNGTPLPSFAGEPREVLLAGNIDELSAAVWQSLNADHKISLYVRFTDLNNSTYEEKIINKY